jgi:NADPH-dependent 2,4-dienoyl-CoA reductase/sulfur reductase-like enzyme
MRFVVVGGGVSGVCCAEELCRLCPDASITLVSADRVLKGVSVVARLSRCLEELALVERRLNDLPWPNLRLVQGVAAGLDAEGQVGACLRAVRCKGVRVGRHVAGCWLGFTGRGSHAAGGGSR